MGPNDEYFTPDATKQNTDSAAGQSIVNNVPDMGGNAGSSDQTRPGLNSFFGHTLTGTPHLSGSPSYTYSKNTVTLKVNATSGPGMDSILWSASSSALDDNIDLFVK